MAHGPISLPLLVSVLLAAELAAQSLFEEFRHEHLRPELAETLALAAGDFDRDGDIDLVRAVSSRTPGTAPSAILWNDGAAVFRTQTVLPLPAGHQTHSVLAHDLDRDGDLDLLLGSDEWDRLRQLRNDGKGNFVDVTASTMPASDVRAMALALGDLDADGDVDLVCAAHATTSILLGDGKGNFQMLVTLWGSTVHYAPEICLCDFDGDGRVDIVVSTLDDSVWFHRNLGNGAFKSLSLSFLPQGVDTNGYFLGGDFDGDGDIDFFRSGKSAPSELIENLGQMQFRDSTSRWLPTGLPASRRAVLIDANGDSQPDVLMLDAEGHNLLLIGTPMGSFLLAPHDWLPTSTLDSTGACQADFDGDGRADLAVIGQRNRLWIATGHGAFVEANSPHLERSTRELKQLGDVAVADLDKDGLVDLLFDGIRYGEGAGVFFEADARYLGVAKSEFAGRYRVGDFDGDRLTDILVLVGPASPNTARNHILQSYGRSYRATLPPLPSQIERYCSIEPGDVDGDGDLDLLVSRDFDVEIWLNDGSARFTLSPHSVPVTRGSITSPLFDADGDGDLDFLRAIFRAGYDLLLNDGKGVFRSAPASSIPTTFAISSLIMPMDWNLDGNVDIWLGDSLWQGDGRGGFTDVTLQSFASLPQDAPGAVFADFDLDGDIDLFQAGDRYYERTAQGVFVHRTSEVPAGGVPSYEVEPLDADGDGDVDILRTHLADMGSSSHLLVNRLRHTRIRELPRTGRNLELELYLDPGRLAGPSPMLVLMATRLLPKPILVPGMGHVALDPAAIFAVTGHVVPSPAGFLQNTMPIPAAPGLKGLELHVQSLFLDRTEGSRPRLGNLVSTRIVH